MFKLFIDQIKTAIALLILFSLITGLLYPAFITLCAQIFFPWQANGSLLNQNTDTAGSLLIGQSFNNPAYFWSRPSATTPYAYNAENSSGSNLGPTNPALITAIKNRITALQHADRTNTNKIPIDLVTTSASGLDPDISLMSAYYQLPRIAMARKISQEKINQLIREVKHKRFLNLLGEPRVNVLEINLALDRMIKNKEIR